MFTGVSSYGSESMMVNLGLLDKLTTTYLVVFNYQFYNKGHSTERHDSKSLRNKP